MMAILCIVRQDSTGHVARIQMDVLIIMTTTCVDQQSPTENTNHLIESRTICQDRIETIPTSFSDLTPTIATTTARKTITIPTT